MSNHISHASIPYPIKNARFTVLTPFLDADGDPTDPTTPDTEVSQDAGAFADAAEEVTTISGNNGCGYITFTGAETNNSAVAVAFKVASGPKATLMTLYPKNLAIVGSGTLSAGSAGGGTLGTVLAYDVCGCFIRTTGGTGGGGTGGASNQARRIITYTTSTGAFTVSPNWETTPSTDTTYDVLLPEGVTLGMLKTINPTTAGRTLDVSSGGEAGLDWANIGSPTTAVSLSGTSTKALEPTTSGRTLDVTATGEAGIDWANVGSPTTTLALTGTTIATTQKVDVETIKTQTVTCAAGVTVSPFVGSTGAAINGTNANTLSSHDPGATIGTSTLTQTQVTGGAYALNSASFAFSSSLDFSTTMKTSIGTAVAASAVASVTGNVGGNVTGSVGSVVGAVGSVTGAVGSVTGAVGSVTGNVGGNVTGTVGGFTAAAVAQFFTLDSTKVYSQAVSGSVVKEIASNASATVSASDIRAAIGMASANLDTQLAGLAPGTATNIDVDIIETEVEDS